MILIKHHRSLKLSKYKTELFICHLSLLLSPIVPILTKLPTFNQLSLLCLAVLFSLATIQDYSGQTIIHLFSSLFSGHSSHLIYVLKWKKVAWFSGCMVNWTESKGWGELSWPCSWDVRQSVGHWILSSSQFCWLHNSWKFLPDGDKRSFVSTWGVEIFFLVFSGYFSKTFCRTDCLRRC